RGWPRPGPGPGWRPPAPRCARSTARWRPITAAWASSPQMAGAGDPVPCRGSLRGRSPLNLHASCSASSP
ncbi:hypothetical protein HMPREF0731_0664, partial [Pseudoroseomonas cervicalis ATCC 49957]